MANEGKGAGGNEQVPAKQTTDTQSVTNNVDLDKNPIKFATHEPGKFDLEPHDKPYMEMTLRAGQHSEPVQKILRQRIEQRAMDFPRWPGDCSSGVRVMWIESRFFYDRERLSPDFDQDWRSYRAKYLHSLSLHPHEPVHVPEYEKSLINPIRRFYMKGGDWLENNVIKKFTTDKYKSSMYRVLFTRGIMIYFACMASYYYVRYHHRDWESKDGPLLYISRPMMYPNHPRYPFKDYKTEPGHHSDLGFSSRTIYKDLRDYEDTTVVL